MNNPQITKEQNVRDAIKHMNSMEVDQAAENGEFPKWARKLYAADAREWRLFDGKVRRLTGQLVSQRLGHTEVFKAYRSGVEAEALAAQVAAREPVGKVVFPLKVKAVEAARQKAHLTINKVRKELEEGGWNIAAVAPYPYRMQGYAADAAKAKSSLFSALTEDDPKAGYQVKSMGATTTLVVMSEKGMDRYVARAEQQAALEYDAFICKLVVKVGDVIDAELVGDHVWSYSVLRVTKREGVETFVERWKTQQIWNVSVLGLHFPQWPTRLMK